jgi:hypothetical protein
LEQVEEELGGAAQDPIPTQRELFEELLALQHEFDEVRLDRKASLSVVTEPIILEGLDLGRFEISLDVDGVPHRAWGSYQVMALDANPAASDTDTTHPHVQGSQLCEGDGRVPIQRALGQGRLLDFFVLVRQILNSYNVGSAYVSLERWNAVECRDCGSLVGADDRDRCRDCESDVCYQCTFTCGRCEMSCCGACVETCRGCRQRFCGECIRSCAVCREPFCQECLTHAKCSRCRKGAPKEGQGPEEPPTVASVEEEPCARPSLQPLRVGEASVPA